MGRACRHCRSPEGRCVRSCNVRTLLAAGLGCCNQMQIASGYLQDGEGHQLRRVVCQVHGDRLYDPAAYVVREEDWSGPQRWLDLSATHPFVTQE